MTTIEVCKDDFIDELFLRIPYMWCSASDIFSIVLTEFDKHLAEDYSLQGQPIFSDFKDSKQMSIDSAFIQVENILYTTLYVIPEFRKLMKYMQMMDHGFIDSMAKSICDKKIKSVQF